MSDTQQQVVQNNADRAKGKGFWGYILSFLKIVGSILMIVVPFAKPIALFLKAKFGTTGLIGLVVAALTLVTGYIGFKHKNMERALENAETQIVIQQSAIDQYQTIIENQKDDLNMIKGIMQDRIDRDLEAGKRVSDLEKQFVENKRGQARDFGELIVRKPEAMSRIINDGTEKYIRCLENATGAKNEVDCD